MRNVDGALLPLNTPVTLTPTTGASQISRYNGGRCVSFDANVGGMIFATVLGVFVVPVLFALIVRRKNV